MDKDAKLKKVAIVLFSVLAVLILMVVLGDSDDTDDVNLENKEYFTEKLKKGIDEMSRNSSFKNLQYENNSTYMIVEYDYTQCVKNCNNEIDNHALKIYKELSNMKTRIENTDISEYISIWAYSTLVDEYGNNTLELVAKYEMDITDLFKINFDNFNNIQKYKIYTHNAMLKQ